AAGLTGNRSKDDLGRRYREVRAMVFSKADEIDAELVGENCFAYDVSKHLGLRIRIAVGRAGNVAEGVESKLELGVNRFRVVHLILVMTDTSRPCGKRGHPGWLMLYFR